MVCNCAGKGFSAGSVRIDLSRSTPAMSSNAMRDAQFCRAGRFCERLWPFLVVKAASSAKIAPTQHNEGVSCDQLVGLLEPTAQPTHVFCPFFARSPKVLSGSCAAILGGCGLPGPLLVAPDLVLQPS
eukprot:COSAG04_NODE_6203_length_1385_cov_2.333593_2_plen_128_part_00